MGRGKAVRHRSEKQRQQELAKASSWWARSAYGGHDREVALVALEASGLPQKTVRGSKDILSAMSRGEALIKGAAGLSIPRRSRTAKSSRYVRLVQWRLVMAYAGFEIFAKACLGKGEKDGIHKPDIDQITSAVQSATLRIEQPILSPKVVRWLTREGNGDPIDVVGDFLRMGKDNKDHLHQWFKGRPITNHSDACHLAKILRHATAHGLLSPEKCLGLGFMDALTVLPKAINDVRREVVFKIYQAREGGSE
jgi:hypothetical protein